MSQSLQRYQAILPASQKNKFLTETLTCIISPNEHRGGLFIGNISAARNPNLLLRNGIRAVITVASECNIDYEEHQIPFHMKIKAEDNQGFNICPYFEPSNGFIDNHRRYTSVLVHCFAGISRSATLVIAYLMKEFELGFGEALSFVRGKRPQICPNPSFIQQLKNFEAYLDTNRSFPKVFDFLEHDFRYKDLIFSKNV